jgi:hypothetical protein
MAIAIANSIPVPAFGLSDPQLRHGSYFPDWLLGRRKRAERALTTVVANKHELDRP